MKSRLDHRNKTEQSFYTPDKTRINIDQLNKLVSNEISLEQDRIYAEEKLKLIYSEQLSKILNEKKYYLKNQENQQKLQIRLQVFNRNKLEKIEKMKDNSVQKRQKILKDRVKVYENNDKKWFYKKQMIKQRLKTQGQQFLEKSRIQHRKSQSFWKLREKEKIKNMKQYSSKYHNLYNSNYSSNRQLTIREKTLNLQFNQSKLSGLYNKKKEEIIKMNETRKTEKQFRHHRERQRSLTQSVQKQKLQKIIVKLNKIQKSSIKREETRKKQLRLKVEKTIYPLKVYKNNKQPIGQQCSKYSLHQQKYRNKTQNSRLDMIESQTKYQNLYNTNRSQSNYQRQAPKQSLHDNLLQKYHQKTKRFKIVKILKTNIRKMLNTQFKKMYTEQR